jgi:hypothetical protein
MRYDTEKMRSKRSKSIDSKREERKQRDCQRKADRRRKYEGQEAGK